MKHFGAHGYVPVSGSGWSGWVLAAKAAELGDPGAFAESVLSAPARLVRKGGGQGITAVHRLPSGAEVYAKSYPPSTIRWRLRNALGPGRAALELEANLRAAAAGLRIAPVVAALRRESGLRALQMLVSLPAEGELLKRLTQRIRPDAAETERVARLAAAYAKRLHAAGVAPRHLNCQHLFLGDDGEFAIIDLEGCRFGTPRRADVDRNIRTMTQSLRKFSTADAAALFERLMAG